MTAGHIRYAMVWILLHHYIIYYTTIFMDCTWLQYRVFFFF